RVAAGREQRGDHGGRCSCEGLQSHVGSRLGSASPSYEGASCGSVRKRTYPRSCRDISGTGIICRERCCYASAASEKRGTSIVNTQPMPGLSNTVSEPEHVSTARREIDNP